MLASMLVIHTVNHSFAMFARIAMGKVEALRETVQLLQRQQSYASLWTHLDTHVH